MHPAARKSVAGFFQSVQAMTTATRRRAHQHRLIREVGTDNYIKFTQTPEQRRQGVATYFLHPGPIEACIWHTEESAREFIELFTLARLETVPVLEIIPYSYA